MNDPSAVAANSEVGGASSAAYAWLGLGSVLAAVGLLLHLASFGCEAVGGFSGWLSFSIGLSAVFEYNLKVWFANPAYWLALGLYGVGVVRRRRLAFRISTGAAVFAFLLALSFWLQWRDDTPFSFGFFAWLGSFLVQGAASAMSYVAARRLQRLAAQIPPRGAASAAGQG